MKKPKGYMRGGQMRGMMKKTPKGMKAGGKLEMVEKDGKMVPFFAADGKGKMKDGGMVPKTKGYFKGSRSEEQDGHQGWQDGRQRLMAEKKAKANQKSQ